MLQLSSTVSFELRKPIPITIYIHASVNGIVCKQIGSRSGPNKRQAQSGSKLYDTLMVFLKKKSIFLKNYQ